MAPMSQSPAITRPHVLVVDDETVLAGMVANYLQRAGFRTTVAHDGPTAVTCALSDDRPDVVVLDLGLPGKDGMEVCHEIRRHSDCYILMLTARNEEIDKLLGLSAGADDYMTKPFSARELVARVKVLLRRPRAEPGTVPAERTIGELTIDPGGRRVTVRGVEIDLTRTEFDLLAVLSARAAVVFSRRELIDAVWSKDWVGDEHLVDVHIAHLRRKLGEASEASFVDTVRGVGYRMGAAQ
ncbi:MAG: DNA-binding response regulator [Actinobacteria bacterium HGW-Actinobacteria-2]|nr:MAG: DNA-binding response regulator [Actinobacteria bacterium HGW-Actinobacteria-2]